MHRLSYESDSDISISSGHSTRKLTYSDDVKDGSSASTSKLNMLKCGSNNHNNGKYEKPAELFRKDLISAMKLPDTEILHPDDYILILDQWRQEWERGVQVPVNSQALHTSSVKPKKLLHATADDQYKPAMHELHETQKMADEMCRYDLDDIDMHWLRIYNDFKNDFGQMELYDWQMERLIEELETRCYSAVKAAEAMGMEYDEDTVCDVCRMPDVEEGNEMVFCDGCDVGVHQACYGILKIPKGSWVCRTCAVGLKPRCVLCTTQGGAMKSTKDGSQWTHLSCAIWVPEVTIVCSDKMEPIDNIDDIPMTRWNLICCVCKERSGACIQCCVKKCKTSFHVTCAFKMNFDMKLNLDDNDEDLQLKAFCGTHSKNKESSTTPLKGHTDDDSNKCGVSDEKKIAEKSRRMRKIVDEFFTYVDIREVSKVVGTDLESTSFVYEYWKLKRKSNFNKALLTPKMEEGDILLRQRQDSLMARLRMFIHLRQDLERVRNLCYMVTKRERTRCQLHLIKRDLFMQQVTALSKTLQCEKLNNYKSSSSDFNVISHAHKIDESIYDRPNEIRHAAHLYESRLASEPKNESDDEGDFKYNFYYTSDQSSANNATRSYSAMSSILKPTAENHLTINDLLKCQRNKNIKKSKSSHGIKQQSKKLSSPRSSLSSSSVLFPSTSSLSNLSSSTGAKKYYKTDKRCWTHLENPYAKSYNNFAWLLLSNRKKRKLQLEKADDDKKMKSVEGEDEMDPVQDGQMEQVVNVVSKSSDEHIDVSKSTDEHVVVDTIDDSAAKLQEQSTRSLNSNYSDNHPNVNDIKDLRIIHSKVELLDLKRQPLRDVDGKHLSPKTSTNKKFKSSSTESDQLTNNSAVFHATTSFIPLHVPLNSAADVSDTTTVVKKSSSTSTSSTKTSNTSPIMTVCSRQSSLKKSKSTSVVPLSSLPSLSTSTPKLKARRKRPSTDITQQALTTSAIKIAKRDIIPVKVQDSELSDLSDFDVENISLKKSPNKSSPSSDNNVFANINEFSIQNRKKSNMHLQKNQTTLPSSDYSSSFQQFSSSFKKKIVTYRARNGSKFIDNIREKDNNINAKNLTNHSISSSSVPPLPTVKLKLTSDSLLIDKLKDCTKITNEETHEHLDVTGSDDYDGNDDSIDNNNNNSNNNKDYNNIINSDDEKNGPDKTATTGSTNATTTLSTATSIKTNKTKSANQPIANGLTRNFTKKSANQLNSKKSFGSKVKSSFGKHLQVTLDRYWCGNKANEDNSDVPANNNSKNDDDGKYDSNKNADEKLSTDTSFPLPRPASSSLTSANDKYVSDVDHGGGIVKDADDGDDASDDNNGEISLLDIKSGKNCSVVKHNTRLHNKLKTNSNNNNIIKIKNSNNFRKQS